MKPEHKKNSSGKKPYTSSHPSSDVSSCGSKHEEKPCKEKPHNKGSNMGNYLQEKWFRNNKK